MNYRKEILDYLTAALKVEGAGLEDNPVYIAYVDKYLFYASVVYEVVEENPKYFEMPYEEQLNLVQIFVRAGFEEDRRKIPTTQAKIPGLN